MTFEIRRAELADADAIGRVHAQSWREAYAGILSPAWIAAVSDEERMLRWRRMLSVPGRAKQWVAVATDSTGSGRGDIVGFASSGPSRDVDAPRAIELWAIYLLKSHSRQGIGRALAETAVGTGPAAVWVLAENTEAQAFYRSLGFVADGTTTIITHWENVVDMRMLR